MSINYEPQMVAPAYRTHVLGLMSQLVQQTVGLHALATLQVVEETVDILRSAYGEGEPEEPLTDDEEDAETEGDGEPVVGEGICAVKAEWLEAVVERVEALRHAAR